MSTYDKTQQQKISVLFKTYAISEYLDDLLLCTRQLSRGGGANNSLRGDQRGGCGRSGGWQDGHGGVRCHWSDTRLLYSWCPTLLTFHRQCDLHLLGRERERANVNVSN